MYFVKRSSTVPTTASRALKTYWGPFGLMDAHQAEGLRAVRTPIVVRPEPDIPVIGRLLFALLGRDCSTCSKLRLKDPAQGLRPACQGSGIQARA